MDNIMNRIQPDGGTTMREINSWFALTIKKKVMVCSETKESKDGLIYE